MRKRRLLWRLFFAYLWITLAVMSLVGLYASLQVHGLYLAQTSTNLEAGARAVAVRLADRMTPDAADSLAPLANELGESLGMRVTIILPSGKVMGDSDEDPRRMENHADRPEIIQAMRGEVGRSQRYSRTLKEDLKYVAVPVWQGARIVAVARTAVAVKTLTERLNGAYLDIALAGLAGVALAAAISYWVSRRMSRPLEEMRAGAERFARGELQHRLPDADSEEISMLAESMNYMAEQLDQRIHTILRQQNEREAMLSSMEEGVLAVDNNGTVLSLNDTCAALLGAPAEKLCGRLIHEVIRKPPLLRFVEAMLASAAPLDSDLRFAGTEERWFNVHGTVLHDAQQRKIGVLIVLHDVTRLRRLESVRRDFVANVSHELRTPITSIKGFVETLLDERLEDKPNALRFLGIVLRQVNRLDAIIRDLLMLSRIERGSEEQTIEAGPEPLRDVLIAAIEMCETRAADKRITLSLECPEDLAARMNGPLLEQAVVNLVDNAIKYSEAGATVWIEGARDGEGVLVQVKDQGCGIAPNHLPRLFERFYRVDKARSRELGGTGLGLAIVKHIVVAHQGSVHVESAVGRGSTFSIRLPPVKPAADGSLSGSTMESAETPRPE